MTSVRKSLAISFSNGLITKIVAIVSSMILARLLTPEDIGMYSVTVAFVALAHMFRDFGIGNYLVQVKNLEKHNIAAAFGVTLCASWAMAFCLYISRGMISEFYNEPALSQIISILCLNFILLPLSSPLISLLRRNMKFDSLLVIGVSSVISSAVVSIYFAYNGHAYMSLAYGSLSGIVVTILVANYEGRKNGIQTFSARHLLRFSDWKPVINFGLPSMGANFVGTLSAHSSDFIIGKILGFSPLGLFSRGQGLLGHAQGVITQTISSVMLPKFSQIIREDKNIEEYYCQTLSSYTAIIWPVFAVLAISAEPIIVVMFGDQWVDAAVITKILCMSGVVLSFTQFASHVFIASGKPKVHFYNQLITTPVKIAFLMIGSLVSLEMVGVAQVASSIFICVVLSVQLRRTCGISPRSSVLAVWRSGVITVLTSAAVLLCLYCLPETSDIVVVFVTICVASVSWILCLCITRHPLWGELSYLINKMPSFLK